MAEVKFNIDFMKKSDVPSVARLEKLCFSKPWSEGALYSELEKERCDFFTLIVGDEVKGYAGSYIVLDECFVANVAVDPSSRRMGFGMALVKRIIDNAYANSCSLVTLEVRESNIAAIRLYSSFDFKEAGRRKSFYSDPTEDGIIMTKLLHENSCY